MRTRLVPLVLVLTFVAGCGGDEPRDEDGRVTVGDVALATPDGWERIDEQAEPPLVTSTRFVDPDRRLRLIQVVVGCDPAGLDALVGAVGQPRGELVVTGARERTTAPEVPGLDRVRRVTLDLGSGREGEDPDFTTEALYGQRGDALVLIELNVPTAASGIDADAVLDSVAVDGDSLAGRCTG